MAMFMPSYLARYYPNIMNDVFPIWDNRNTENTFVEFEMFAEKIEFNNDGWLNAINDSFFTCHICDVNVPILFTNQHNSSKKHQMFKNIIELCLDRLKRQINYNTVERKTLKQTNVHFCDSCSIAVPIHDKFTHSISEEHLKNESKDKTLIELEKILLNNNEYDNNRTIYVKNREFHIKTDNSAPCNGEEVLTSLISDSNESITKIDAAVAEVNVQNETMNLSSLTEDDVDINSTCNNDIITLPAVNNMHEETEAISPNDETSPISSENSYVDDVLEEEIIEDSCFKEVDGIWTYSSNLTENKFENEFHLKDDSNSELDTDICQCENSDLSNDEMSLESPKPPSPKDHVKGDSDGKTDFEICQCEYSDLSNDESPKPPSPKVIKQIQTVENELNHESQFSECTICNTKYPNDRSVKDLPSQSNKHNEMLNKADASDSFKCEDCKSKSEKELNSEQKSRYRCILPNFKETSATNENIHEEWPSLEYYCGVCNIKIPNNFKSKQTHNQSKGHCEKLKQDVHSEIEPAKQPETNQMQHYLLEPNKNDNKFNCLVCLTIVGRKNKSMRKHINDQNHKSNYNELLQDNMIESIDKSFMFCHVCDLLIEEKKEIVHINTTEHINLLEDFVENDKF